MALNKRGKRVSMAQCESKWQFCESIQLYCVEKKNHLGDHTFKISKANLKRGF